MENCLDWLIEFHGWALGLGGKEQAAVLEANRSRCSTTTPARFRREKRGRSRGKGGMCGKVTVGEGAIEAISYSSYSFHLPLSPIRTIYQISDRLKAGTNAAVGA